MNTNPSWFIFLSFLFTGITIILSSTNWFIIWVGFELTLLSFLPMFHTNYMIIESQINYFLIQAVGSALFILSFLSLSNAAGLICCTSIILNLGLFPFYQWVPSVMNTLPWEGCLILISLQNIPAIIILTTLSTHITLILSITSAISILLSGVIGFNQTYLRQLIAYSSISHTGWLTLTTIGSTKLLSCYFSLYIWTSTILFIAFNRVSTSNTVSSPILSNINTASLLLILNIGGLPPFSLFFLNMCILILLTNSFYLFPPILLGIALTIYYYLTITIPIITTCWQNQNFNNSTNSDIIILLLLSLGYPLIIFL